MGGKTLKRGRGKFPRGLDPYSGDHLVDFIFREFLYLLDNKIVEMVYKKDNLKDPDTKEGLWGLWFTVNNKSVSGKLFLEAKQPHRERLKIFIHELTHVLFYRRMLDRKIWQMTRILWRRLTEDQKRILKSYIPKHKVKGGPPKTT